ncbi:MAG: diacylglycerol kinase [Synergistaceae bacterium]|nr:diacylglycerol kinase [Synergistaceae bacterium]
MKRYNPAARLYRGTRHSLSGLFCAFKQEQAFEFEAVVLALLFAVLLWAKISLLRSVALIGAWLAVMALELVNSAVERAFDLIDKEYNSQIKAGKDMLSAAVFLAILFNALLWGMFFYKPVLSVFFVVK